MSCRINRAEDGSIESVTDRFGRESELFKQINKVLDNGANEDVAYAAYLKATSIAKTMQLSSEPSLTGNVVQGILESVNDNWTSWENVSSELKIAEAQSNLEMSLHHFLNKVGVKVRTVPTLRDEDGNDVSAAGLADMTNRVIQLSKDSADISTLSEETAHFVVEILRKDDNPLFKSMYNLIEGYQEFKDISKPDSFYFKKYDGNIDMLKREAIAKVVTTHLVNGEQKNESKENVSRLKRWWDRVMQYIGKMMGKTQTDPFTSAAEVVFNNNLETLVNIDPVSAKLTGTFYQDLSRDETLKMFKKFEGVYGIKNLEISKLSSKDFKKYFKKVAGEDETIPRYVGKKNTPYEDQILKLRGSDANSISFNRLKQDKFVGEKEANRLKNNADVRMEFGTQGHLVMEDLVGLVFENNSSLVRIMRKQKIFTDDQVKMLHKSVLHLKKETDAQQKKVELEGGPKGKPIVLLEQFISDEKQGAGGKIDLLVLYTDNSAGIYDYKFKGTNGNTSKWNKNTKHLEITGDMYANSIEGYDSQLGIYRDALLGKYGITKVRQSRIIPVAVKYKNKDGYLFQSAEQIAVWTGSEDDSVHMQHIPVAEEMTGIESVDKLIQAEVRRYRKLSLKLRHAPFKDREELQLRMNTSRSITKDLQLSQNVTHALSEAARLLDRAEQGMSQQDPFTLNAKNEKVVNPKYLTEKELLELYEELQHFKHFTELYQVRKTLRESKSAAMKKIAAKLLGDIDKSSGLIGATIDGLRSAIVYRMDSKAKELGIKNFKYNRAIGYSSRYLDISEHDSPYSRYVHETMQAVNGSAIRFEKKLQEDIQQKEDVLKRYADSAGISLQDAFSELINPVTFNLHAKYSNDFYIAKDKAIQEGDSTWMQKYYSVNEEYYNEVFTKWKTDQFRRLGQKYSKAPTELERAKQNWLKRYDVKNHASAWLDVGGKYFTFINEEQSKKDNFITAEFNKISRTPELKEFYDFHVSKIKEFERRFGTDLGHTFVPNVQKSLVDSLLESDNKWSSFTAAMADNFKARQHQMDLSYQDKDGNPLRQIPRLYTAELTSEDEFGNEVVDKSLRSTELGRSLYLLGQAAIRYELKTEIEDEFLLIKAILDDGAISEVAENKEGRSVKAGFNRVKTLFTTASSAEQFTDIIDNALYGVNLKTKDIVSKDGYSLNRTFLSLKTFHSIAALGLKTPVALGAMFSGTLGIHIQGSKALHFTNKQVMAAEAMFLSRDPKVRAVVDYFQLAVLDVSNRRADMLSSSYRAKYLTGDRWFEFLAQADKVVDSILGVAMAQNHGFDSNGKLKRLSQLPKGTKSLLDSMEMTDNPQYKDGTNIDKYTVKIPGESDAAYNSFRARHKKLSTKIKGTAHPEAVTTAGMSLINRFFLHYRSWLPGLANERFSGIKFDNVLDHWDQGTWRGFFGNFGPDQEFDDFNQLVTAELGALEYASTVLVDIGKIALDISTFGLTSAHKTKEGKARIQFEQYIQDQSMNEEFKYDTAEEKEEAYQQFLEMKRGNLKGAMAELRSVIMLLMLMMMLGGDWDEDGKVDIRQTYAGRKMYNILSRVYRETAVFWDPTEMTGPRSTGIPLLGLIQDGIKLVRNTSDELWDRVTGRQGVEKDDRVEAGYYTFKLAPGLGGLAKALEIYPQHKQSKT